MQLAGTRDEVRQGSARLGAILVVENKEYDSLQIRQEMRKLGVLNHVHWVATTVEMIAYLFGIEQFGDREEYPLPVVIILDLTLPGVDGFETEEWLRCHPKFSKIPIIVIGTRDQMGALRAAVKVGANNWLVKPFAGSEFHRMAQEMDLPLEFRPGELA
jgi:CheY-like chemotaxis protein